MSDWRQQASALSFGESRKIECCGNSPSLYIRNTPKGISAGPCFRCGFKDWEPHGKLSLAELMRMRKQSKQLRSISMPALVPLSDASPHELLWLLKSGLSVEKASSLGFYWSPKYSRIVFKIDESKFIARAVHSWQKPKYITNMRTTEVLCFGEGTPVVVEDILSAIKVSRAGYKGVCVFGTAPKPEFFLSLPPGKIVGWFDADKAGDEAWKKFRRVLALSDLSPVKVRTEKDPKLIPVDEIRDTLERALCST